MLAALLLPALGAAEAPDLRFERISIDQGLSQNSLTALMQDRMGFLWIGTDDGLNRYDGYRFETLRNSPTELNSLSNNRIRALLEDRDGILWIGTRNGGLNRYDRRTRTFTHYRHDPEVPSSLATDLVWALHQDHSGTIWVGTGGGGLDRFEPDRPGMFEHLRHDPDDPGSLSQGFVRTLFEDRSGNLWAGTARGLNRLDADTRQLTRYLPEPDAGRTGYNSIGSIEEDRQGRLWLATWSGLMRFDPRTESFTFFGARSGQPDAMSSSLRDIHVHADGTFWLASHRNGILVFDPENRTLLGQVGHDPLRPTSLSGDQVKIFLEDRSGAFWVGTSGNGLNKLVPPAKAFAHYRSDPATAGGLPDNMVMAIHETADGGLWVGTRNGGLDRLTRRVGEGEPEIAGARLDREIPTGLVNGDVRAILEDSAGRLWVGTENDGLYRLDDGSSTHYRPDPANPASLRDSDAWVLLEDRAGTLWVGTYGGGLSRYDRETGGFRHYLPDGDDPGSLSSDVVRAIHQDAAGVLWIGTGDGGLNRMDPAAGGSARSATGPFRNYRHEPGNPTSLSSDDVLSILEDRAGNLWVGTHGGGLNRFLPGPSGDPASGSFRHYVEEDGMPSNVVYGILEDEPGRIWMSTNRGLSRFDPPTESFRNYDVSDGLQDLEFNSGAYVKRRGGEMLFGGINGLNAFYPDRIEDNSYVPPVVLTSFEKFNRPVPLDTDPALLEEVILRHDDSVVSFGFAALSYTAQHKNRYAYRLVGFRDEWTELGTRREVTFTNLSPGAYELQIRASNNDGVWNDAGLKLALVVEPPFWRTWWFLVLAALTVVGVLRASYKARTRRMRRHNRELEAEVTERRQAQEESAAKNAELELRNAEMERFVYTVSHDLKTPLVTIKGFVGLLERDVRAADHRQMTHDVARIGEAADTMRRLLEDLLELSRVGRLMNPAEPIRLTEVARDATKLLTARSSQIPIRIDPHMPTVDGDRQRLLEVYQNLIENAVKFLGDQPAPRIEIGAEEKGDEVLCWVRDNGIGIDPAYQEQVFGLFERLDQRIPGTGVGLALVKRIVEVHGGRCRIESEGRGRGCAIYFTLPPAS